MSGANRRHVLFPFGVEAAAVLAWGLLLLGLGTLPVGIPFPLLFPLSAAIVATVLAWGLPDPDYGASLGGVAAARGGLVIPRVATVSMLLGVLAGVLWGGFLGAVGFGAAGIVASLVGGLLGRRFRA